jgi:hypothetical protein
MSLAVDHAVVNVLRAMDAAVPRFRDLGFTLTPRGHHSLGSINHLMVFGHDYLELVGLPDGDGPVRREVADAPRGLNGLVFATADAGALHQELASRGIAAQPPLAFDRPVEVDGATRHASFRTVRLDADWLRGGRVYFCQHDTPELVWRKEWQDHRNGVHALAGMTIAVPDPAQQAQRYRELGAEVAQQASARADEVMLAFGHFVLRLTTPGAYAAHYGRLACDAGGREAFMGALALRTDALDKVRASLEAGAIDHQSTPSGITLPAASWFNAVIEFTE